MKLLLNNNLEVLEFEQLETINGGKLDWKDVAMGGGALLGAFAGPVGGFAGGLIGGEIYDALT